VVGGRQKNPQNTKEGDLAKNQWRSSSDHPQEKNEKSELGYQAQPKGRQEG